MAMARLLVVGRLLLIVGTSASGDADRACAVGLHADCFESGCCADSELACFKRPEMAAAQCLPRQQHCVDTAEWLCPGWELCAKRLGNCHLSRCCQSTLDECYQKDGEYAECREQGTCVGKTDPETNIPWLCSVLHPPTSCTYDWQECTASKCCVSAGFTCREKTDTFARCLRVCPDPADAEPYSCAMHDKARTCAAGSPDRTPKPHEHATGLSSGSVSPARLRGF